MSNVTFADLISGSSRDWCLYVKIQGVGPALLDSQFALAPDGMYRFCTAIPDRVVAGDEPADLWRDYLTEVPDLLSELGDPLGGLLEYGSVSVGILDGPGQENLLTRTLQTDSLPATSLALPATAADLVLTLELPFAVDVFGDPDVIFIDNEAVRVNALSGNTVTVDRGYLGTQARPHAANAPCFQYTPFIGGRRLDVFALPLAAPLIEARLVGSYAVDGVSWDAPINAWEFTGRSQVQAVDQVVPAAPRSARVISVAPGDNPENPRVELSADPNLLASVSSFRIWFGQQGTLNRLFYLQNGDEVVGAGSGGFVITRSVFFDTRRIGGTPLHEVEVGDTLKQVFSAEPQGNSFRYSPGPAPSTDRTAANVWVRSDHWVDIILNILTSSAHPDDGLELTNFIAQFGNWSIFPPGYGAGIPAADLDWNSWIEAKRRTTEFRFPNFVYGGEPRRLGQLISDEFLRPVGAFISAASGQIRLVMPKNPSATEASVSIGVEHFLARRDGDAWVPDFRPRRDLTAHRSEIRYLLGPGKVDVGSRVERPGLDTSAEIIPVPSAANDAGPVWAAHAEARARRRFQPATEVDGSLDASLWELDVGQTAALTIPEVPEQATGIRGWNNVQAQVLEREPRADVSQDGGTVGVHLRMRFRVFGASQTAVLQAPAGWIATFTTVRITLQPNTFTSADATDLPARDRDAFRQGATVTLVEPDGTPVVGAGTAVIIALGPGPDDLDVSSNFNGQLRSDVILVLADFDASSVDETDKYAFMGDRTDGRLGAGNGPPYLYGET